MGTPRVRSLAAGLGAFALLAIAAPTADPSSQVRALQSEGQALLQDGRYADALTRYEIERGYPRESLLRVELGTGRTHQIRVHLAGLDHALVGDGDYGSRELNRRFRERWGLARVFLHASELEIPHPRSGKPAVFSSALPVDLRRVLDGLDSGKGDDARSRRPRRRRGGS